MNKSTAWVVAVAVVALTAAALVNREQANSAKRRSAATPSFVLPVGNEPKLATDRISPEVGTVPDDLVRYARSVAGPRFGGLWLAQTPSTGYRVGLVAGTAKDVNRITAAFDKVGLPGEVVSVATSESRLNRVVRSLRVRLAQINRKTLVPISIGVRPDLNAVLITAPFVGDSASAQQRFVYQASTDYGAMVRVNSGTVAPTTLPCRSVFCDPPLRGGVWIYGSFAGCTGAFITRSVSDGRLFQLTAGHCQYLWNGTWLTDFVNGGAHQIGRIHNRRFDAAADAAVVAIDNPVGWRPRAWVAVRSGSGQARNDAYSILGSSTAVVGQRVCSSGAGFGPTSCGVVTRTGVALTYRDQHVTVYGLMEANFCTQPGDSGAPVFAGHIAYGIVSGQLSRCDSVFVPIKTAEAVMKVRVARDGG